MKHKKAKPEENAQQLCSFLQTKPRCQSMKSLPWKPKRALCCEPSFASSADFLVWYNWNNAVGFLLPADALHKDTRVRTAETKLPPFWAQLSPASPADAFYRFTCTLQLQPVANSPRCLRVKRGSKASAWKSRHKSWLLYRVIYLQLKMRIRAGSKD